MFKRSLLLLTFAVLSINANSQEFSFGANAGYLNINASVENEVDRINVSESASGFYIGAIGELMLSQNFGLEAAVNYGNVEETNFLMVPVLAKLYVAQSKVYFQAGPQVTFLLEDTFGFLNTVGIDLSGGVGYDINENFFVSGRYSYEITNRIPSKHRDGIYEDINGQYHSLNIGLGYKF